MARLGNRKGFTLMELMVYIAILGIVVLVAGQAFSNSTKFRVRTTNMLKANDISERVVEMFSEDVSQMGAKTYKSQGDASNPDRFEKIPEVYMDADGVLGSRDSSSYALNAEKDSLMIKRVRYNDADSFMSVEEVSWFKRGNSIYRLCKTTKKASGITVPEDCPENNPPEVLIADYVDTFEILPAKPGVVDSAGISAAEKSLVLPVASTGAGTSMRQFRLVPRFDMTSHEGAELIPLTVSPADGGTMQGLSGFAGNYDSTNSTPITNGKKAHQVFVSKANTGVLIQDGEHWKTLCSKVTLDSAVEYEISFKVPYSEDDSRLFCPGRDHAAVGFRKLDGSLVDGLSDFLFFPPASSEDPPRRSFRFSVKQKTKDVCIAFTFATYSPATSGKISISDLTFKKVESSNYDFKDDAFIPTTEEKQNVKAFMVHLVINRGGEKSNVLQTVATPSNGPKD